MEAVAGAFFGVIAGLVASALAFRGQRHHEGLGKLLDRLVDEDHVLDEVIRDPQMGREYSRTQVTTGT